MRRTLWQKANRYELEFHVCRTHTLELQAIGFVHKENTISTTLGCPLCERTAAVTS